MSVEESDSFKCKLAVTLPSDTPVVGIEINPRVLAQKLDSLAVPELTLRFAWHRKHNNFSSSRYGIGCSASTGNENSLTSCGSWHENAPNEESESINIGHQKSYVPTLDDLGSSLSLESVVVDPLSGAQLSEINIVTTKLVITPPVSQPRSMIECSPSSSNFEPGDPSTSGPTFSVLTYNVLADLYATIGGKRYRFCPSWARVWEYRRELLLSEIVGYDADILCLQEVQSDHFEDFFEPKLTNHGYSVLYKKKASQLYVAHKYVSEGCATFYRRKLFKGITKYELEFDKMAIPFIQALGHSEASSHHLSKDNVALVAILETLDNESYKHSNLVRICVANTHISANSQIPAVKLFQVVSLVNELTEIFYSGIPLLICGDFNSLPLSDPHRFIVTGKCDPNYNQQQDPLGIVNHLNLRHSLPLASAYASFPVSVDDEERPRKMNNETNEPMFTYMTGKSSGTLDYIFYTENNLRVDHLLDLLDRKSLRPGLPSPYWPSDHIALMAGFRLLNRPSSSGQSSESVPTRPHSMPQSSSNNFCNALEI